jgi:ubiquinone/menaquinone biosynthesis C-methylase UbiE
MPLNSHYDDDPARYAAKRQGWLNQRRRQRMVDFLAAAEPGQRVLDLGAGTGDLAMAVAAARPDLAVTGVEPLESYVAFAKDRAEERGLRNVEFRHGFAEDLTSVLPTGSVDWLVSSDVLHHVADERAAVASISAVAAPGARWLAIEPNRLNPYILQFQALTRGERNFRAGPFLRVALAGGWRLDEKGYLFLIPSVIAEPKPWMKKLEERLESWPVLGGAVTLDLVKSQR